MIIKFSKQSCKHRLINVIFQTRWFAQNQHLILESKNKGVLGLVFYFWPTLSLDTKKSLRKLIQNRWKMFNWSITILFIFNKTVRWHTQFSDLFVLNFCLWGSIQNQVQKTSIYQWNTVRQIIIPSKILKITLWYF